MKNLVLILGLLVGLTGAAQVQSGVTFGGERWSQCSYLFGQVEQPQRFGNLGIRSGKTGLFRRGLCEFQRIPNLSHPARAAVFAKRSQPRQFSG